MKKIKITIVLCMLMLNGFSSILNVNAAGSFSLSRNTSTVTSGGTVSVTLTLYHAEGQLKITATNGATVSASGLESNGTIWIDSGRNTTKNTTLTVKAPSSGTFTVTVEATSLTSHDAEAITGSKSLSFTVSSSTSSDSSSNSGSTSGSTPEATVDTRDSDSNLSSLTVSQGVLSPEFSSATTDYVVFVDDLETIILSAVSSSNKATVSGVGEKTLELGENKFEIIVKAENESTTTYKVTVNADKSPEIFTHYNEQMLGVVQNQDLAPVPDGYDDFTVTLDDKVVPAYYNSTMDLVLLYLADEEGNREFYIYSDNEIISVYRSFFIAGRNLVILDIPEENQELDGFIFGTVVVDDNTFFGWTFEEETLEGYRVFKALDEEGVYTTFLYDSVTNTMIRKPDVLFVTKDSTTSTIDNGLTDILIYSIGILSAITVISLAYAVKAVKTTKR